MNGYTDRFTVLSQAATERLHFMDISWKSLANLRDVGMASFGTTERKGDHMNTRIKIAASGLLVAALAAAAVPAIASETTTVVGKVAGHVRHMDGKKQHVSPLAALVTAGTITQAQADTVETATRTAMQTSEKAKFTAGLASLVSKGTITQAQADAAQASLASALAAGKHARPDLSSWTAAQHDALRTWMDANEQDRAVVAKAALAKLVTAGTITQTQSEAIEAALAAGPGRDSNKGPRGGKGPRDGRGPRGDMGQGRR